MSDPLTIEDLKTRATVTVPEAGKLLGIGKSVAYTSVKRGDIPALRIGNRLLVPASALLEMLGIHEDTNSSSSRETRTEGHQGELDHLRRENDRLRSIIRAVHEALAD